MVAAIKDDSSSHMLESRRICHCHGLELERIFVDILKSFDIFSFIKIRQPNMYILAMLMILCVRIETDLVMA
jgi:hypothetical protein